MSAVIHGVRYLEASSLVVERQHRAQNLYRSIAPVTRRLKQLSRLHVRNFRLRQRWEGQFRKLLRS